MIMEIRYKILNGKIQLDEVQKALNKIRKNKISGTAGYPDDWAQGLI